jgi:hypothetical protein
MDEQRVRVVHATRDNTEWVMSVTGLSAEELDEALTMCEDAEVVCTLTVKPELEHLLFSE